MTYTVCKDFTFAAAHRIEGHAGECRNLHGHNYRVRVCVGAETLDEIGMVLDFAELKAAVRDVVGRFDHRVINEVPPFDDRSTTAEELAAFVFREVRDRLSDPRLFVRRVEVWENDTSCAIFEDEP